MGKQGLKLPRPGGAWTRQKEKRDDMQSSSELQQRPRWQPRSPARRRGSEGRPGCDLAEAGGWGHWATETPSPPSAPARHPPGRAVPLKPGNQDPLHVVPRGPELGGDRHREAQCHWSAGSGRPPASPRSLQRCHQAQASTWLRLRLLPRGWKRQAGLAQPPTLAPRESSGSGTAEKKTCCKLLTSARKTIKSLEQNPLSKLIF